MISLASQSSSAANLCAMNLLFPVLLK